MNTRNVALFPLLILSALAVPGIAKEKGYENFDLPKESSKVALPDTNYKYSSARVNIRGGNVKFKESGINAQQFLFAKETYLTEKRDEAIKLLRQELDSGQKANQDNVLLRLGQLYTEKYMELSFREGELYNQQYQEHEKKKVAGQASGPAPKSDNSRSAHYLKEALSVFYRLEKEYPKHPRIDEIIYFIGFVEMESGNNAKGQKYLERILKQYPGSRKFDDAAVYLGDHYFDIAKFKDAATHYRLLISRDSALKDYARYKLAWCDLNTGSPEKAVRDMKSLIGYLGASPDTSKFSLREQALRDLVVFYGETDKVDDAMDFFSKAQGKTKALDNLKVLAELFRSKAQDEAAVKAYSRLIKEFGDAPETPKWYLGLYDCESRIGKAKGGVNKLVELVERYGETSEWAKTYPKEKAGELKDTLDQIASESEKAAYFHHQAGQKSSDKGHYDAAIKLYSSLLKNFPSYANRKKIAFFRGEALFNQSRWLEAADSYMMAAQMAPKDKLSDESIYDALLSVDHLTDKNEKLAKYSKEEAKQVDTTPKELAVPEKKFIEIGEYYLKEYPQGERTVDIRFRIASIYYQNHHFDEAMTIFQEIALHSPKHRTAPTAAHLALDIFNIRKDYDSLTKTALLFASTAGLGDAQFKAEMKQLIGEVDFKQIEPLEKQSKWADAGESYYKFYQANPNSNLAEKSLYNAYVSFDKAGNQSRASEVARVFVAKFPSSDFTPKISLSLAKLAEKNYDFEQAMHLYSDFHKKHPKDKEARKALYNAAVFAELLEKYKDALTLYEQYEKEGALSSEEKRSIQLSQAKIYRKEGKWDKVATTYRLLMKGARGRDEKVGYLAELARQYERAGKISDKNALTKEIHSMVDPKRKSAMGVASMYAAEAEFDGLKKERTKYDEIKLRFPPEDLIYLMKRKERALGKLASHYDGVVEFGVPEWGVAALYEKAEAYSQFVASFRAVQIPRNFKGDERTEVENSLKGIDQKNVVPLEAKSQEILKACASRAADFHVSNEYAAKCLAKLKKDTDYVEVTGLLPQPNYWSLRSVSEGIAKK